VRGTSLPSPFLLFTYVIGPTTYGIEEISFGYDLEKYLPELGWGYESDPRFPNGVFIYSYVYPNLVWDTKGYQFGAGTPVILHNRKDTLVDTKNQRWVLQNDTLGIIYNQNMVANVTAGKVVLAWKANSSFQKFYFIDIYRVLVDLKNDLAVAAQIFHYSPTGNTIYDTVQPGGYGRWNVLAGPGNYIIIKDTSGNNLAGPYDVIQRDDIFILPPPGPIPVGTNVWTGYEVEDGIETNVTYTLTFFPQYRTASGNGSDKRGQFTFYGYYYSGGDFVWTKVYETGTEIFMHAMLDSTGRRLIGDNGSFFLKY
jgi:hypothetical protein